jgi:hypothetical protein
VDELGELQRKRGELFNEILATQRSPRHRKQFIWAVAEMNRVNQRIAELTPQPEPEVPVKERLREELTGKITDAIHSDSFTFSMLDDMFEAAYEAGRASRD